MARKQASAKVRNPKGKKTERARSAARLYTLEVFLLSGPVTRSFARKNPVVSRTIQIRGDQTLQDLHHAIFDSFGRHEEHMYEFQFGKGPMDPKGPRYVLPGAFEVSVEDGAPAAGTVDQATLDSLDLEVDRSFAYWFDFGDDWWHQVNVDAMEDKGLKGKYPKVTKRVGENPPQYEDLDKEPGAEAKSQGLDDGEAADAACLVGELHLSKGDYQKAIEAFTRAIETNPTVDAYQGRASAHRALAIEDDVAAQELN